MLNTNTDWPLIRTIRREQHAYFGGSPIDEIAEETNPPIYMEKQFDIEILDCSLGITID